MSQMRTTQIFPALSNGNPRKILPHPVTEFPVNFFCLTVLDAVFEEFSLEVKFFSNSFFLQEKTALIP